MQPTLGGQAQHGVLHAGVIEAIIGPVELRKPQCGPAAFGRGILHDDLRSCSAHGRAEQQQLIHLLGLGTLRGLLGPLLSDQPIDELLQMRQLDRAVEVAPRSRRFPIQTKGECASAIIR
jgi:hypothetical protein